MSSMKFLPFAWLTTNLLGTQEEITVEPDLVIVARFPLKNFSDLKLFIF